MIHYSLRCGSGHDFDGWFKDSGAFDVQIARDLLTCPTCGTSSVARGLMAPAIPRKGAAKKTEPEAATAPTPDITPAQTVATGLPDQVRAALQRIRAHVEQTSDYVGPAFADEARKIHRGESEYRNIYGESTREQAEQLADEGIEVSQVPWVPRADG